MVVLIGIGSHLSCHHWYHPSFIHFEINGTSSLQRSVQGLNQSWKGLSTGSEDRNCLYSIYCYDLLSTNYVCLTVSCAEATYSKTSGFLLSLWVYLALLQFLDTCNWGQQQLFDLFLLSPHITSLSRSLIGSRHFECTCSIFLAVCWALVFSVEVTVASILRQCSRAANETSGGHTLPFQ